MTSPAYIAINREDIEKKQNWLRDAEKRLNMFAQRTPQLGEVTVRDGNDSFGEHLRTAVETYRTKAAAVFTEQQATMLHLAKAMNDMLDHWNDVEEANRKAADFYQDSMAKTKTK